MSCKVFVIITYFIFITTTIPSFLIFLSIHLAAFPTELLTFILFELELGVTVHQKDKQNSSSLWQSLLLILIGSKENLEIVSWKFLLQSDSATHPTPQNET